MERKWICKLIQRIAVIILSLWASSYAYVLNWRNGISLAVISALIFFLIPCCIGFIILAEVPYAGKWNQIGEDFRLRNKRIFFMGIFVLAVIWLGLKLNSSSISKWQDYIEGWVDEGLLWGMPRVIRSDEWAVWTPHLYSQANLGYPAVNTAINASAVDPTLIAIGGLPAWTIAAVLKPFYWGFLVLGIDMGYSLMTLLRFGCLLWVSYRCAIRYTGGSKGLSLTAACLITLSPYVQWWFSQSICEVLIFSQGMLLSWIRALETQKTGYRIAFGVLGAWCLGCFVMVLYPSWLIPVAFLTIAMFILYLIQHRKSIRPVLLIQTMIPFVFVGGLLFLILQGSRDTLTRVQNSVYPGQRVYSGGNRPLNSFTGFSGLILPIWQPETANSSSLSNFLSFAPAGIMMTIYQLYRTKKKDIISLILFAFVMVFGLLSFVRLPEWFTTATLLSYCTRPMMIVGLCDLILLVRALAAEERMSFRASTWLALGISVVSVGLSWWKMGVPVKYIPVLLVTAAGVYWMIFSGKCPRLLMYTMCMLAVIGGLFVNPIQQGITGIRELPIVELAEEIGVDSNCVVATEGDWPATNALLFSGARVLNATQPYADNDRWKAVDPEEKWENIYNRLCHISLEVGKKTKFKKIQTDYILARLTLEDLRKLEVDILFTQKEYDELELLGEKNEWKAYSLEQ